MRGKNDQGFAMLNISFNMLAPSVTSHTVICGEMEHTVGIIAKLGSRGAQIKRLGFVDAFGITRC